MGSVLFSFSDETDGNSTNWNFREELPLFKIRIRMEGLKHYSRNECGYTLAQA